jgi:hypothetical protein
MSTKYIAPATTIAARKLGDEMVIMSAVDSTLFTLNPVGTAIWQAADGRTPLTEIVEAAVCAEFEVELEAAYPDAEAFVEELAQHGILKVSDQPIPDASPESR